ncbi:MAG: DEAD/DEAH box helicase family protein, partial [Steroidobacteraceae bacterium]
MALDTPLRRLFDYLPPASDSGFPDPVPGMRVRVPFGRRRLVGTVVELADSSELPLERLKPILEVLDPKPLLDAAALELIRWTADYYHHPIGEVLAGAIPRALRLGAGATETEERWTVTEAGAAAQAAGEPRRARSQRSLLEFLSAAGDSTTAALLDARGGNWRDAARALKDRAFLTRSDAPLEPGNEPVRLRAAGPQLLPEQDDAVEQVGKSFGRYAAFLLEGVTGSGKTEVYLRLTERVLAQGRGVLVLVPEIGLTPQLVARFRERFEAPLAVLHSALTDSERLAAWRDAWSGRARIVLG